MIKKFISKKHLLLCLILPLIITCQNKSEYPKLLDKITAYSDNDYEKDHFQDFQIYKSFTTKNGKLQKAKLGDNLLPWSTNISKERAKNTLYEIEKNISVSSGIVLSTENTSGVISFSAMVSNFYSQKQLAEYKKTETITTENSVLDNITAEVKSYDLTNEKNKIIKLNQNVLGIKIGGFEFVKGNLLQYLSFETLGLNHKYATLKGSIEIVIKIPVEYEKIEITENSIGKKYTIGGQEIQILDLDSNILHYKLFDSDIEEFSYYIPGEKNNSSKIQIPESIYEKFRQNQGLDYSSFIKKYKELGLENINRQNEKNYVSVIENDDSQIGKIFFYKPKKDGVVEKVIKVPIHITQLNKS